MKIDDFYKSVIEFMTGQLNILKIPKDMETKMFSSTGESYQPIVFGAINKALRTHCINIQENIITIRQFDFLQSIISIWWDFENRLYDFAIQLAKFFDSHVDKNKGDNPLMYYNKVYFQVVKFGFRNWADYVLNEKLINDEFLSTFELIKESPLTYPFKEGRFANKIRKLMSKVQIKDNNVEGDIKMLKLIATNFRLFKHHDKMYKQEGEEYLERCSYIADMLPLYLREGMKKIEEKKKKNPRMTREEEEENLRMYKEAKEGLLKSLDMFEKYLNMGYVIEDTQKSRNSIFYSFEYIELMKMRFKCNPELYMKEQIPNQIELIKKIIKDEGISLTAQRFTIIEYYARDILPIYNICDQIVSESLEARKSFAFQFKDSLLPPRLLEAPGEFFYGEGDKLRCIWTMCKLIPDYVILISNAFIEFFKPTLNVYYKRKRNEDIQETVSTINSYVNNDFLNDPLMVLSRSSLYIPFQSDIQLAGRARGLIEQAHEPAKMKVAIRELFDIVPNIKCRNDLFTDIGRFIQNSLLSEIKPNIELEKSLLNSMGQYVESDLIDPIRNVVDDFSHRYDFFNSFKISYKTPPEMQIAVLSYRYWKDILSRGTLDVFSRYSTIKDRFAADFSKKNKNMVLFFCDPSSVVEVRGRLRNSKQEDYYLFNGVQYAIVKLFETHRMVSFETISAKVHVDDIVDQVDKLVQENLLIKHEDSNSYEMACRLPIEENRNFAKKYTSAENIAQKQFKEQDIEKSIECCIVRILKRNRPRSMDTKTLIKEVVNQTIRFYTVEPDKIRERIRDLEIKKYITLNKNNEFEYLEG